MAEKNKPVLAIRDLAAGYGKRRILQNVRADICPGEVVGIIGPNGAGKSTLLKSLCGILPLAGGSVRLAGQPLDELSAAALARQAAYLPQAIEVFARRCEGPMKEELAIVLREYRLGLELPDALQRMYDRLPCEDLQLLIISIRITLQSGGSLADVLQRITQTIRGRIEFHQKLQALTAQGRFEALAMSLAPLLAFTLLFFINHDLMLPMVKTLIGWSALGIMVTLEIIGYAVIRAIIDVKV